MDPLPDIPPWIASLVLTFAGAVGLLLALIGVFALVAYTVTERRREPGIRLALGADRRRVLWFALREGFLPAAIGLATGLPPAVVAGVVLRSLLVGVPGADRASIGGVPLVLGAVALVAAYLPARRALRADPLAVLREE